MPLLAGERIGPRLVFSPLRFLKARGDDRGCMLIEEYLQRLQLGRRQHAAQRFELDNCLARLFKDAGMVDLDGTIGHGLV